MAEPKTKPTSASVSAFLDDVADPVRRQDCKTLIKLMTRVVGAKPVLWGSSIVGFGSYHYKYASGHEGTWPLVGFSPRKSDLTVYLMPGFAGYKSLLARLGPHKTGKGCLYLKRLDDVDLGVLETLVAAAVSDMKAIVADRKSKAGPKKA